jgi:hypothetical protein
MGSHRLLLEQSPGVEGRKPLALRKLCLVPWVAEPDGLVLLRCSDPGLVGVEVEITTFLGDQRGMITPFNHLTMFNDQDLRGLADRA